MKQQTHSQEQQLEAMNTCMHKPSQVSNEEIEHSNGHIDTPVGLKNKFKNTGKVLWAGNYFVKR